MEQKTLKQKWGIASQALLSPSVSVLIVFAIGIIVVSALFRDNLPFTIIIGVFGNILIAIAGAVLQKEYERLMGDFLMEKKGRSAIQNLQSIDQQIYKIGLWINKFLKGKRPIRDNLKEVDRHLSMTRSHIQAGIEDWVDIVPELKRMSALAIKETELLVLKQKVSHLEDQLSKSKNNGENNLYNRKIPALADWDDSLQSNPQEQITRLLKQIGELQKELSELSRSNS